VFVRIGNGKNTYAFINTVLVIVVFSFAVIKIESSRSLRHGADSRITTLDVVNEVTHRMMLAEALGKGVMFRGFYEDGQNLPQWQQPSCPDSKRISTGRQ